MSQNTEQNVRTREDQITALATMLMALASCKPAKGDPNLAMESAKNHVLEAEARGAAVQRRKDAEGQEIAGYIPANTPNFFSVSEAKYASTALHRNPFPNDVPVYYRPANVAALEAKTERRFQHVKRGTEYRLIGRGKIQQNGPSDMAEVVIYQDVNDGSFWVRSPSEFYDGRFKEIFGTRAALTREGGV